jgi:hypothetical protein
MLYNKLIYAGLMTASRGLVSPLFADDTIDNERRETLTMEAESTPPTSSTTAGCYADIDDFTASVAPPAPPGYAGEESGIIVVDSMPSASGVAILTMTTDCDDSP